MGRCTFTPMVGALVSIKGCLLVALCADAVVVHETEAYLRSTLTHLRSGEHQSKSWPQATALPFLIGSDPRLDR